MASDVESHLCILNYMYLFKTIKIIFIFTSNDDVPWVRLADLALDHGCDVGGVMPLTRDKEVECLQEFDGQVFAGKLA